MSNHKDLLRKSTAVSLIVNFLSWQSQMTKSSFMGGDVITKTVKTVFDMMLNNGDVAYSDWVYIEKELAKTKPAQLTQSKADLKQIFQSSIFESLTNTTYYKNQSLAESISVENLKAIAEETGTPAQIVSIAALMRQREAIDQQIDKLQMEFETELSKNTAELLNKYGKHFPDPYLTALNWTL